MLSKKRIWYTKQEKICEQPAFTRVNEIFEQVFGESSRAKEKVLKRG